MVTSARRHGTEENVTSEVKWDREPEDRGQRTEGGGRGTVIGFKGAIGANNHHANWFECIRS